MIHVLLCAAAIHGIYGLASSGGFLHTLLNSIPARYRNTWLKPIITCPKCMASLWGTAYYLLFPPGVNYFLFIFAVSGIGEILRRVSYSDEPNHEEPIPAQAQDAPPLGAAHQQPATSNPWREHIHNL